jgi:hypothetical protein
MRSGYGFIADGIRLASQNDEYRRLKISNKFNFLSIALPLQVAFNYR